MNQALSSQTMKNLLVKSGKIEYQFGDDFSGKEIFYFDDFGTKKSITENRNVIGGGKAGDRFANRKVFFFGNFKQQPKWVRKCNR